PVFRDTSTYHTRPIGYFQMPFLRYLRYHGISRYQYLPYSLNQLFSKFIPTILTHTTVIRNFNTYRTRSSRYSQNHTYDTHAYHGMGYLVNTGGTLGTVPHLRFP
ncbi:unnamed protein product, partial [Sphacelaria rigidula]